MDVDIICGKQTKGNFSSSFPKHEMGYMTGSVVPWVYMQYLAIQNVCNTFITAMFAYINVYKRSFITILVSS